jgi:hypothetical protein
MGDGLTPVRAIRRYCLQFSGESPGETRTCTLKTCLLYPFRMGRHPARAAAYLSRKSGARGASQFVQKEKSYIDSHLEDGARKTLLDAGAGK